MFEFTSLFYITQFFTSKVNFKLGGSAPISNKQNKPQQGKFEKLFEKHYPNSYNNCKVAHMYIVGKDQEIFWQRCCRISTTINTDALRTRFGSAPKHGQIES
jgi:hypothetical protein